MTRDDIAALRGAACQVMAALGSVLDSLQIAEDVLTVPARQQDAFADAVIISQHLDEAAATADQLAERAHFLAIEIDRQQAAQQNAVSELEKGGVS